ncbi:enoyl-CoA hydratase-related protein [Thalassotalea psychrophila]|uniref:Enoyl-CoA hydratase-related protein n=1 Tax=Thalassotalea psychrophila TaxID=3065647 RepID=A0ABY9U0B6_9GAMM|nr:enoyl-CoA hydratase-related protein [Colwelliaceae bacterium SQ149]
MSQFIHSEQQKGVLTITLNRADKKNALDTQMYERLCQLFTYANETDEIRCLLIQGDEKCFCSGNDLADFIASANNNEELAAFKFIQALCQFEKPLIAAVAGPAVGIGTTMLLHCDMVIAASNSKFILPFSHVGICLEAGASLLLPLKVGSNRAFELGVLGNPFDAEQAYQYGIVNQVCEPEMLLEIAKHVAEKIARMPDDPVQTSRKLLRSATDKVLEQVIESERDEVMRLLKTDYCQSAVASLLN